MKVRSITGRVDHQQIAKKIPYKTRNMDYKEQWARRRLGVTMLKQRNIIVNLTPQSYQYYRLYAKRNRITISDGYKKLHPRRNQNVDYILRVIWRCRRPH